MAPVVAIGAPGEPVPPYGASRGYYADDEWQPVVDNLIESSRCIVICLDQSKGVLWELNRLFASGHWRKTLFLIHPRIALDNNRTLMLGVVARITNTPLQSIPRSYPPVVGFFFDEGRHPKLGFSTNSQKLLTWLWCDGFCAPRWTVRSSRRRGSVIRFERSDFPIELALALRLGPLLAKVHLLTSRSLRC